MGMVSIYSRVSASGSISQGQGGSKVKISQGSAKWPRTNYLDNYHQCKCNQQNCEKVNKSFKFSDLLILTMEVTKK